MRSHEALTYIGYNDESVLRIRVCASMRFVQMFDSLCFQNVLSDGDDDSKNDKGQSTNQLSRIYVGMILYTNINCL